MMDPMSEDAQILRARKARYSLTHAMSSVITRRVPLDLIDAYAPVDQGPVARAHITETAVPATKGCIERRLEVLTETRLRPQDLLVDLYAEPRPDPKTHAIAKTHAIEDMREKLSSARARVIALEAENRQLRAVTRQIRDLGPDDRPVA